MALRRLLSDTLFGSRPSFKAPEEEPAKPAKEVELRDRIDDLGFGWYQIQVWVLSAGFVFAEGSEIQMASGLVNAMSYEFDLVTHNARAMLMTWTFTGFCIGTMSSGPLGDNLGRRVPMALGYSGVLLTACCTILVSNLQLLYIFRFVLGFFAGIGIPNAFIAVAEVTPSRLRGRATAAFGMAYVLGEMWAASGMLMLMPDLVHGSWRALIAWAMIPASCLLLMGMISSVSRFDTPFYLGCHGRTSELRQVLDLIAEINSQPDLKLRDEEVVICEVPNKIPVSEILPTLMKAPIINNVSIMAYMMFAKDFAFYGSDVFWPQIWVLVPTTGTTTEATHLMYTTMLGIPGVLLAVALMHVVNRRMGVLVCATVCSVCMLSLRGLEYGKNSAFLGVLLFKLCFPTWQMTTMVLPSELFGTQIRSWAFSFASSVGRLATIASPFAVELGTDEFTGILAGLALGAAMMVLLLPETKDCVLCETVINEEPSPRTLVKDDAEFKDAVSYGAA